MVAQFPLEPDVRYRNVKRVSAGAKIETIVEQARKVEAGSTDRLAVVQDLAILCLVGLRQLAEEIDGDITVVSRL